MKEFEYIRDNNRRCQHRKCNDPADYHLKYGKMDFCYSHVVDSLCDELEESTGKSKRSGGNSGSWILDGGRSLSDINFETTTGLLKAISRDFAMKYQQKEKDVNAANTGKRKLDEMARILNRS